MILHISSSCSRIRRRRTARHCFSVTNFLCAAAAHTPPQCLCRCQPPADSCIFTSCVVHRLGRVANGLILRPRRKNTWSPCTCTGILSKENSLNVQKTGLFFLVHRAFLQYYFVRTIVLARGPPARLYMSEYSYSASIVRSTTWYYSTVNHTAGQAGPNHEECSRIL